MFCFCKIFLRSTTLRHVWVELSRQRSSWGTSLPTITSVQSAANCFGVLTSCICTWATSGALSSYKFLTNLQRSLTYSQESRISLSSSAWSWSSKETSTAENGLTIEHGNVFEQTTSTIDWPSSRSGRTWGPLRRLTLASGANYLLRKDSWS